MLNKITIAAALTVFATGCSTPIQGYWPASSKTAHLQIRGELVDMADVKIFINGEKVIDDRLALLSGDGEFHGSYEGQEVTANCSSKAGLVSDKTRCAVYVGHRRASTLAF
jgi:hypothetical protein